MAVMQFSKSDSSFKIGKITETEGADKSFMPPPFFICTQLFPAHNLG